VIQEYVNLAVPVRFTVFDTGSIVEDVLLYMAIGLLAEDLVSITEFFDYNQIFGMSAFDDITITEDFNYTQEFDMFAFDDVTISEATAEEMPDEGVVFEDIMIIEEVMMFLTELAIPLVFESIIIDDTFTREQLIIIRGMRRMRLESKIPNPKFKTQSKIDYFTHVQEVGV
jgi:hypothetical protein